jgi:hypothetical protein
MGRDDGRHASVDEDILRTSRETEGQIYAPSKNYLSLLQQATGQEAFNLEGDEMT